MFKEVQDLSPDTVIAIGGLNKKTGKKNPTSLEGYYLGKRSVDDKKKKSGLSYIYVFQTSKGTVGVWGKTDLDRKMGAAVIGAMLRVTSIGTVPTPNGDMYKYKVEIDTDNTIEVTGADSHSAADDSSTETSDTSEESYDSDTTEEDDSYARVTAAASAERQAKVKALLNSKKA